MAYMAMAAQKEKEEKHVRDEEATGSTWDQWKRGSMIGAAALTGGTLLAITGGIYQNLHELKHRLKHKWKHRQERSSENMYDCLAMVELNLERFSLIRRKFQLTKLFNDPLLISLAGLAAPAIAAGMAAIGSAVPILGASGLSAAAAVAGSAVGSAAVAASFGGSKSPPPSSLFHTFSSR